MKPQGSTVLMVRAEGTSPTNAAGGATSPASVSGISATVVNCPSPFAAPSGTDPWACLHTAPPDGTGSEGCSSTGPMDCTVSEAQFPTPCVGLPATQSDTKETPSLQPGPMLDGLRFLSCSNHHSYGGVEALTAMAEGQMQCAVTGSAFEFLLQHASVSVVQTVRRNAVVFARMRPHQKGQVMELLNHTGLHHAFQGQSRYLPVS